MLRTTTRSRLLVATISMFIILGVSTSPVEAGGSVLVTGESVREGDNGNSVREVQNVLYAHGYTIALDGVFGPQTRNAVLYWQRSHGLHADGVVGPQTTASLGLIWKAKVSAPKTPGKWCDYNCQTAYQALLNVGATVKEAQFGIKICSRESHCTLGAVNKSTRTKDDSWGPWQINYYGRLIVREQSIGLRESNVDSWEGSARNFLTLLRGSGACHWQAPNYCAG